MCYSFDHGIYAVILVNSTSILIGRRKSKAVKMQCRPLPRSDLTLLAREVLAQPPTAALPSNLSDQWLDQIGRDLDICFGDIEAEGDEPTHMAAPLALIIHLLSGKQGTKEIRISIDQFKTYLTDYRIEIGLEMVNRRTNIHTNEATLETIFESRQVLITAVDERAA